MVVNTLYYGSAVGRGFGTAPVAESSGISISDDIIAAALRNIYSRDFNHASDIEPNLFNAIAATLADAVTTGATVPGASALGKDPFLDALRHSTDVFAAFKTHRAQNDMAARLLDSNGNLKPFEQWKKEVLPIADHQCHNWLETEYNTAVLRARQAANWQQFQAEKDILPNLKWLPSTSPNPGADHLPFWNTILPIDHPFWDRHRPGDRWNCKCNLTSTDEPPTAVPSLSSEVSGNNPQPGLKDNPGKTQALFSDDHPYFPSDCKHCAFYKPSAKARLATVITAQIKDCNHCPYIEKVLPKSVEVEEIVIEALNNGHVHVSSLVSDKDSDYDKLMDVAKFFANEGREVFLTPKKRRGLIFDYDYFYSSLKGTKYYGKCPDLKVITETGETLWYEHEGFISSNPKNAFRNMMKDGLIQSNRLIIDRPQLTERFMLRSIIGRVDRGEEIEEVWIRERNGNLTLLYKKRTAG